MCLALGPSAPLRSNRTGHANSTPRQEPQSTPRASSCSSGAAISRPARWTPGHRLPESELSAVRTASAPQKLGHSGADAARYSRTRLPKATWQPLGPTAVHTPSYRPRHRPRRRARPRSLRPNRQPPLPGHNRRRCVGREQCRHVSTPSSIVFTPLTDTVAALSGADRRFHQHRRAHGAAGRNRRDSGRHRRPQRRARLLLRRRHPALQSTAETPGA